MKNCDIRVRVSETMRDELDQAVLDSTHRLSISQIVERGIVLALAELAKMESRKC